MTIDQTLKDIYYNPSHYASFGSIKSLFNAGRLEHPELTIEQVREWLSGENTYTLHRQARRNFKREKILVSYPNEQFQADLVDMKEFSRTNSGFKYILTVIDCFSRYAFAVPVKNKTGEEIRNALKVVFESRKPQSLQTDRGKEFLNSSVQEFLKSNEIKFFTTFNTTFKCAIVERFNRTLKSKMFKYFSHKGTRKYIDIIKNLLYSYNNSYHRTIKTTPSSVNENNREEIFENIYGVDDERQYLTSKNNQPKLKSGDKVRIKYELTPMDKSYYPNWTDVVYTVNNSIKGKSKPMYELKSFNGNKLSRKYYPEEVQKIKENYYRIEKIIKPETRDGIKGYIVKWVGYSSQYNSWVPEDQIQNGRGLY